jgi:hypothetical protein
MRVSDWRPAGRLVMVVVNSYLIFSLNFVSAFAGGPPNQRLHQVRENA